MTRYYNLGAYERPISTSSSEAALWFNRGLNWCYAFHGKRFAASTELRSSLDCAMGYWGRAYAVGPYISYGPKCRQAGEFMHSPTRTRTRTKRCSLQTPATRRRLKRFCARHSVRFQAPAVEDPAQVPGTTPMRTPCGTFTRSTETITTLQP